MRPPPALHWGQFAAGTATGKRTGWQHMPPFWERPGKALTFPGPFRAVDVSGPPLPRGKSDRLPDRLPPLPCLAWLRARTSVEMLVREFVITTVTPPAAIAGYRLSSTPCPPQYDPTRNRIGRAIAARRRPRHLSEERAAGKVSSGLHRRAATRLASPRPWAAKPG